MKRFEELGRYGECLEYFIEKYGSAKDFVDEPQRKVVLYACNAAENNLGSYKFFKSDGVYYSQAESAYREALPFAEKERAEIAASHEAWTHRYERINSFLHSVSTASSEISGVMAEGIKNFFPSLLEGEEKDVSSLLYLGASKTPAA